MRSQNRVCKCACCRARAGKCLWLADVERRPHSKTKKKKNVFKSQVTPPLLIARRKTTRCQKRRKRKKVCSKRLRDLVPINSEPEKFCGIKKVFKESQHPLERRIIFTLLSHFFLSFPFSFLFFNPFFFVLLLFFPL